MWLSSVEPHVGEHAPQSLPQFFCKALLIILVSLVCIFLGISRDSQMKSLIPVSVGLFVGIHSFYVVIHIRTLGSKMGSSASSILSSQNLCVSINFFCPPVNIFRPYLCGSDRREAMFFHQTQVFAEGFCFHYICHWWL